MKLTRSELTKILTQYVNKEHIELCVNKIMFADADKLELEYSVKIMIKDDIGDNWKEYKRHKSNSLCRPIDKEAFDKDYIEAKNKFNYVKITNSKPKSK